MQLNPSEVQDLIRLTQYTIENESNNYEEFVESGGKPDKHIYWVARRLQQALFESDLI